MKCIKQHPIISLLLIFVLLAALGALICSFPFHKAEMNMVKITKLPFWASCPSEKDKLPAQENKMDIEGFLLASGFALLVVLVGWANQITSKSKETKDLEGAFLRKVKLKKKDYNEIVKEGGGTEDSFNALVKFLYTNEEENLEIFEKIKQINEDIGKLDNDYSRRFWILLWMSICFFTTGIIAFFLPFNIKYLVILPNLFLVVLAYINLIKVHNIEKRYTKNISDAMEKL